MPSISLKASSKGITVLTIIAVVILFACVLAYVAAAGKIKAAVAELQQTEKQVAESKLIAQKLEKSKLEYLDARAQVRNLETSVSSREFVPTLLKQLEHLGRSVNLKVLSVRPEQISASQEPRSISSGAKAAEGNLEDASKPRESSSASTAEKPAPYQELKINVEVQGNYMDALAFLHKLTSFPKIIAVNSVDIAPKEESTLQVSPTLGIKLNLTAFVLKNEEPKAPGKERETGSTQVGTSGEVANQPTKKASKGGISNAAG
jgi:Tfp pilus assembly protein PilO